MNQPQPIVALSHHECLEALHAGVVGRIAVHTPVGTRIVPVNYSVHGDAIVWRTAPYSELATYAVGLEVAFEADHLDMETKQGWSVIAYGRVERVDDPDEVATIRSVDDPEPWADGSRGLYLRMLVARLTGRRLGFAGRPERRRSDPGR